LKIVTASPKETEQIGKKLGMLLKKRLSATVCLYGDLGAGKTTFVRGFASAFGISERDVGSASFVIVAEHDTSPKFYHIDLYRLEGEEAVELSGVWECIGEGISVIEWAERLKPVPEDAVKITITFINEHSREFVIDGIKEEDWNNLQEGHA
jgi:tRNA threonylcarbamoyladenosine biosynthesis protein TsaE